MRRRIEITLLMWICTCCLLVARPLAGQLDSLLSVTPLMRTSEAGIAVYDLTAGTSVYRYQADKLYRPASVEKVITSVTALSVLGTGYTFRTQLAYTGTIEQDTLKGDLYVIGGFDPEFMESDLVRLADAAGQAGIRVIKGRLVGDISLMDSVYWGPGWSWDDTPESFQPYLSPLMLNRGCVDITVSPSAKGQPAKVTVLPQSDYYELDNRTFSRTPSAGKLRITRNWLTNGNRIILTGNVTGPYTRTLNLFDSSAFFMQSFWKRLQTRAVEIGPDSIAYGVCPDEASRLYIHERPLDAVLKRALKKSDNLSAEALFYHVGLNASRDKRSISNADGQRAIRLFMEKSVGISPEDFRICRRKRCFFIQLCISRSVDGLSALCLRSSGSIPSVLRCFAGGRSRRHAELPHAGRKSLPECTCQNRYRDGSQFTGRLRSCFERPSSGLCNHQPECTEIP